MGAPLVFPMRSRTAISMAQNAAGFRSMSSLCAALHSRRSSAPLTVPATSPAWRRMNAAPPAAVSPVTYSRGHPSPYPTSPVSAWAATIRFSARARLADAWRNTTRNGTGKLKTSIRWMRTPSTPPPTA